MNKFRITIASLPDRERLVAEIFYNNEEWVEISQEADDIDDVVIQFYDPNDRPYWHFDLEEIMKLLKKAKNHLLGFDDDEAPYTTMDDFKIEKASFFDKKEVIKIYYKSLQWAEVFQDGNKPSVHLYEHPSEQYWELPYYDAMKALDEAKKKLLAESEKKS